MVLEDILGRIGKRKTYSFLLGFLYVLIAYGTAKIFFPANLSLAMIFFVTLLLVPSVAGLLSMEERIERMHGLHKFFRDHYGLIEVVFFLFLGILVSYLAIGTYEPSSIDYQTKYLEKQGLTGNFLNEIVSEPFQKFSSILYNNITVIVVAFVLSLFYGAGAMFLIVLNASVFASFILLFMRNIPTNNIVGASLLFYHTSHEVLAFLLAAMAGGVISKALLRERIGTEQFRNVVKDGTLLLIISVLLITLAAVVEVYILPGFIKNWLS